MKDLNSNSGISKASLTGNLPGNPGQRPGFTLVEVLVVVGLVVLLAAILFPVFSRSRAAAQRTSCQSNLHQIALGLQQYTGDHNGKFPIHNFLGRPGCPTGWADAIQSYLKNTQVLQCPSEANPALPTPTQHGYTDYYLNVLLNTEYSAGGWAVSYEGVNESRLTGPTVTIMIGDGIGGLPPASGLTMPYGTAFYAQSVTESQIANRHPPVPSPFADNGGAPPGNKRHGEGANYAFADGHVKWLKPDQIFNSLGDQPTTAGTRGSPHNLSGWAATFLIF